MNSFVYSTIITAIASIAFGIFVFLKGKKTAENRLWSLVCLGAFLWQMGLFLELVSKNEAEARFWNRILYVGAIFVPIFYYHFVSVLTDKKERNKIFIAVGYVVAIFFLIINLFSDLLVSGVPPAFEFKYWVAPGPFYTTYFGYFVVLFVASFIELALQQRTKNYIRRQQIKYVMISGLLGVAGGITAFFPQLFGVYPFGNYFVILYIAVAAYAIVRYRLMGIRMIASKVYIYLLISAFAYSSFYFVVLAEELMFGDIYNSEALMFGPFFALLFSIAFIPFFKKVQKSSDVIFFHGYDPQSIIKNLGLRLSGVINLDELLSIISEEFKKILATEEMDIYLFRRDPKKNFEYCESIIRQGAPKLHSDNPICHNIKMSKKIMVRDEQERVGRKQLVEAMDKQNAKIIAPLILRHRVIGVIFLGDKIDQGAYTKEDFDFLEIISSQAAVAIENALLYKEVDDFSKTLQQKVDEQTKELSDKAEHLKKLMEMRSEFLDITSHQLRTPVSVIKGVLSMLDEGSVPEKRKRSFIAGALEKSIKLGEIINDILRVSEMDSDKFTLHLRSVDLNDMMTKIMHDKAHSVDPKKIKLKFILPKKPLPPVLSDDRYLEQAIVNLINNAIQYTPQGLITVSIETTSESVIIRVADTGIGIAKKDIPKLFQKFGRAPNALVAYTDGSGLGLYIIKEIVDANPGAKIEIEKTELGKGTTFALTMPIFNEKTAELVAK